MEDKQDTLRQILIEAAKDEKLLHYGELAPLFGLDMGQAADRGEIGRILDAVNRVEHDAGRPLLSAVVVQVSTNLPGAGFFLMAKRLSYEVGQDRQAFWVHELNRVYKYWAERRTPSAPQRERQVVRWEFQWEFSQEWISNPDSIWCQGIETAEHDWTTRLEFATSTGRVIVVCCGFCDEMRVVTERPTIVGIDANEVPIPSTRRNDE